MFTPSKLKKLKPGLSTVNRASFYWATKEPVPIGFRVPVARPRSATIEEIFEQVRRRVAPEAPSRLNCVFVCPVSKRGFCSQSSTGYGNYVYRVSVTGKVFTTDGGFWTEAVFNPKSAEQWAEAYWNPRGSITMNLAEEALVDGKVVVVKQVWESESAERVASRWASSSSAPDVDSWVSGFLKRHPEVRPLLRGLRKVRYVDGGSGAHGEARQAGSDILIFPKFWGLPDQVRDFVFAHEVGHWVLSSQGGVQSLLEKGYRSGVDLWDAAQLPFGQANMEEGFADAFASYLIDGDVRRRHPLWARWVEEYVLAY